MPAHHRLGLDDGYSIEDAGVTPIEPNEQSAVDQMQVKLTTRRTLLQDVLLMPQNQKFGFRLQLRSEEIAQRAQK